MRKWFVISLMALVSAVSSAPLALAATPTTTSAATNQSGQGLEISPPVIELTSNPGQTVLTTIRIRNVTSSTVVVKGQVNDFGAGTDESGQPQILLNEEGTTRYSLKTWIQPVPTILLAPSELKTVQVTIIIPKNAEPGGHFGVVRFTSSPPGLDTTGVSLSASIGALILMRVNGTITDNLSVTTFESARIDVNKDKIENYVPSKFFEYGPIGFILRFKNDGSIHEKPQGSIVIKDTFGKIVGALNVNDKGGNVLPGSTRKYTEKFDKKNLFGYYTATLNANYLDGTHKLTAKTSFWVIPWKMLLLVILALIVIFFLLKWLFRKYNNYIIAQARKR